jgi:2-isopropylmalate synthase
MLKPRHQSLEILDSTFRDGRQQGGMNISLSNALKLIGLMDRAGYHVAELGFPVSDDFARELIFEAANLPLKQLQLAAFGRTRKPDEKAQDCPDLKAILACQVPIAVLVCKSRLLDVTEALKTTAKDNLLMISESVEFLAKAGLRVILDLELGIDAYLGRGNYGEPLSSEAGKASRQYFLQAAAAGFDSGAETLVVCDTTGGAAPDQVTGALNWLRSKLPKAKLGFHGHDDNGLAVANSRAAVLCGTEQIQGTVNGYGERCGNTNLTTLIPRLQLKDYLEVVGVEALALTTELSVKTALAFNREPSDRAAFVGRNAFKTFAGMHASAEGRTIGCYLPTKPELIGNNRSFGINAQSGASNVVMVAKYLGFELNQEQAGKLLRANQLMVSGGGFEASEISFLMACRRIVGHHRDYMEIRDFSTTTGKLHGKPFGKAEAEVRIGKIEEHTVAKGKGPVSALYAALKKAVIPHYKLLEEMHLEAYDLHAIDVPTEEGEAAVRVEAEFRLNDQRITTAGVSSDSTHAAMDAWSDAVQYFLWKLGNGNLHLE